jgi:TolB-like protein
VSVIAELKRRNVFRVAALYLVAAWVLLQVGDLLLGLLGLPGWTNRLLFAALVLGFVPALIFSWVYELTPEGLKREHEVERNASITAETARKLDVIVIGLLVVAIGMLGFNRWYVDHRAATGERPAASAVATVPTAVADAPVSSTSQLAVLPFELAHADEATGYLGLAIPDAITTRLANVRALRIRPTVTVLRIAQRETDPQRIGQVLGVDYVLTGILYTGDAHVQVNLQLVRVRDDVPVWGENVRVPADELGRLQDHPFVENIIKALRVQITAIERERLFNPQPVDSAAYRLYLAGRADLALHTEPAMRIAVQSFQAAIDRDAHFAAAYAGLATAAAEMALRFASRQETEQWRERALAAAQEAVRLDPNSADAHEAMTAIYRKTDFNWDLVFEQGLRALELNPNLQQPYFYIAGAYYHLGLFDEALAAVDRGIEVNPVGGSRRGPAGAGRCLAA